MRRPLYLISAAGLVAVIAWAIVQAATPDKPDPRVELAKKLPDNVKPEELAATPIPGIYELTRGSEVGYVSSDGRYFFSGELHDLHTRANITESRKSETRRKKLAGVSEKDMIIYGPASAAHTITVFTDIDCSYCRRLHNDVAQLNQLGIRVRYLFYPRSGPGTDSWSKAESVWCASDRKEALDRAMRGQPVPAGKCDASAVRRHFELGDAIGVDGTPGIFTKAGAYQPGYLPPQQMLARLQQFAAMPMAR